MNSTLKIDHDNDHITDDDFISRLKAILPLYGVRSCEIRAFATVRGRHIYVDLDRKIPDLEIVLLQTLLGSDPYREIFNLERVRENQIKDWNVLFCAKFKNGIKVSGETPLYVAEIKLTEENGQKVQKVTIKQKDI